MFRFPCDRTISQECDEYDILIVSINGIVNVKLIIFNVYSIMRPVIKSLNVNIANCTNGIEIESCVSDFVNTFDKISTPLFKKTFKTPSTNEVNENLFTNKSHAPWFNETCREKRFRFYQMLHKYGEIKNGLNRVNMTKSRSEYKIAMRKSRYNYDKKKTDRFENARFKNARSYWNLLKETAGVKPANIPLTSFEQYFKAINNPLDHFYIVL